MGHVRHAINVYMWYTLLPAGAVCLVSRAPGKTLLALDINATRMQVVEWCVANLTVEEQNAYRAAFDQGPVGTPLADDLMEGALRCEAPRALVVYGGPELEAELGA